MMQTRESRSARDVLKGENGDRPATGGFEGEGLKMGGSGALQPQHYKIRPASGLLSRGRRILLDSVR